MWPTHGCFRPSAASTLNCSSSLAHSIFSNTNPHTSSTSLSTVLHLFFASYGQACFPVTILTDMQKKLVCCIVRFLRSSLTQVLPPILFLLSKLCHSASTLSPAAHWSCNWRPFPAAHPPTSLLSIFRFDLANAIDD